MKFEKRQYEERAVAALRKKLLPEQKILAVSPTGSGKTVIAALLCESAAKRWPRILFVAHRHELIDQAYRTLSSLSVQVGVLMAHDERLHGIARLDPAARVQVASVQTFDHRDTDLDVDLIVFDEAHRVMADSYQRIAKKYKRAAVLGLTATPCRLDGRGLGDFFDEMYLVAQPSELQADGYLPKPRTFSSPEKVTAKLRRGLAGVSSSNGDYASSGLDRVTNRRFLVGEVVSEAMRLTPNVPKVVFACSIQHSKNIVKRFKRVGVVACHIDADTDIHERQEALAGLRRGDIEVISNVDVLSEGWDLPALGAVIIARPTKSLARYLQMAGRCTRPYRGRRPVVIDHGDNVRRFQVLVGQDIEWQLESGSKESKDQNKLKPCVACLEFIPYGSIECPECGAEQPKTARQEREEIKIKLEEMKIERMNELRKRVESIAQLKNAPDGWVEKVMSSRVERMS
jgi:superfamily II DNA or RNA helicase